MNEETTITEAAEAVAPTEATPEITYPELLTVSVSPHVHHEDSTHSIMLDVLIALVPALIFGIYVFGFRALTVTVVTTGACILFEFLWQKLMHKPVTISDLSAAVTGVILAFNLPVTVPLWMAVIGALFAIVVVKQLYGGIGKNVVNPALAARVFLMLAWPNQMTLFTAARDRLGLFSCGADAVASATPMATLKAGEMGGIDVFGMFLGYTGGCIGEVSALLLLLGGIYLLYRRVISWHTPVAFLGVVALLAFMFPQVSETFRFAFVGAELCGGGLMLGAIFMATDYATSPLTKRGKFIYGIGCGLITVFIRFFGSYPEGVSFSILVMNTLVWYIDRFTKPVRFGGLKHGKQK